MNVNLSEVISVFSFGIIAWQLMGHIFCNMSYEILDTPQPICFGLPNPYYNKVHRDLREEMRKNVIDHRWT
jgi:hypothetical protein